MARRRNADTRELSKRLRRIINDKPRWGKDIRGKIERYYENKPIDGKNPEFVFKNIIKILREDHNLQTKKYGKETLYYFPHQEDEAEKILMERGEKEEQIDEKFKPVIEEWIKEFPRIDEQGFGVYIQLQEENEGANLDKKLWKVIADNTDRIADIDTDARKNHDGLFPYTYTLEGDAIKLDVEKEILFKELLKSSTRLNYYWKKFKKLSKELWEKLDTLSDALGELTIEEFGLPLTQSWVGGYAVVDSISWETVALLEKIIFYDLENIGGDWNIEIYGVKMPRQRIFKVSNPFIWNGEKFSLMDKAVFYVFENKTVREADKEADVFVLKVDGKWAICLSWNWLVKNYNVDENFSGRRVTIFADFFVSHLNNLIGKIREKEMDRAREVYKVQQNLWSVYRDMQDTFHEIMERWKHNEN